jgi:hypothetical protein
VRRSRRCPDGVISRSSRRSPSGWSTRRHAPPAQGLLSAHRAVAHHAPAKGTPVAGVEDVYLGSGVSDLVLMSLQALMDDHDWRLQSIRLRSRTVEFIVTAAAGPTASQLAGRRLNLARPLWDLQFGAWMHWGGGVSAVPLSESAAIRWSTVLARLSLRSAGLSRMTQRLLYDRARRPHE